MNRVMNALALIALILPGLAGAVDRSHSFGVVQYSSQDAWVTTCTIEAKGIDSRGSYYGFIRVWYNDGNYTPLADVPYSLAPNARQFTEESPGIYKASGKLSKAAVVVTIQVTRSGPIANGGAFGC